MKKLNGLFDSIELRLVVLKVILLGCISVFVTNKALL